VYVGQPAEAQAFSIRLGVCWYISVSSTTAILWERISIVRGHHSIAAERQISGKYVVLWMTRQPEVRVQRQINAGA
jgi:hypothetical protein